MQGAGTSLKKRDDHTFPDGSNCCGRYADRLEDYGSTRVDDPVTGESDVNLPRYSLVPGR